MAMNRFSAGTEAWNGTERMRVATAMSESSSIQSEKLLSLARSLSELGADTANGSPNATPISGGDQPPMESNIELGRGLFFSDGRRKVDYVLAYNYKRRNSHPRLSIVSNGSMPMPGDERADGEGQGAGPDGLGEESKMTMEEKALIREEFENGLLEAGLQIERDKETKSQGIGFIRLHVPWPTLSREAELQKIKVPVKKSYELRERTGIAGSLMSFWTLLNQPFQPDVPDPQNTTNTETKTRSKTLTHPFLREKLHLFDIKSTDTLFDSATRCRIVAEILSRITCTQICQTTGITALLANGVYDSAFPLHDGSFTRKGGKDQRNDRQVNFLSGAEQLLHEEWANYGVMHKYQPVDLIRKYFGEQIGLYFAWLGVYTQLLIPPSVLGVIVFLYGCFTVDTNVPSQETCDDNLNFTMCPLCDGVCDYWRLDTVCSLARASYLFDNGATVFFAIFMSLWAALFLEHWKRRQMCLRHSWDLTSLEDEEDKPRPEYEDILQEKKEKMKSKRRKSNQGIGGDGENDKMLASQREPESLTIEDRLPGYLINISTILLMIGVTFSAVFGVIMYRISMLAIWSMNPDPEAKASVRMTVTTTAIIINLLVVLVLDEIYGAIAVWLTELEIPKTEAEFEERLILKAFFLKSMNAFAPIFYVAFFKGRFSGRPGDYVYIFGDFRMEECAPPGCLIELCIQLSMIMLGKQLIQNNVFEIVIPKLKKMYRTMEEKNKAKGEEEEEEEEEKRPKQQWDKDHALEPFEGLSPEYMEMIIQYGFVSLFVASFPLAPVFALLNNVIEIRLDAAKFVTEVRRPDAVRCKDIGIWYNILCGISKFSVITNAFVISFTSEFIPRMVYQFMYSQNGTMNGYTEHSLAYFNISNFSPGTAPTSTLLKGVSICRYKDYRDPPWAPDAYTFSKQYWSVLAARLAFVIFFQNLAMFLSMLVAWLIPDVPRSLREQLKKENMLLMELLLSSEQDAGRPRGHSPDGAAPRFPPTIDIVVEAPEKTVRKMEEVEEEEEEETEVDRLYRLRYESLETSRNMGTKRGESAGREPEERGDKEEGDQDLLEEGDAGGGQKRVHEGGEKDEEEGVEKEGGGEDGGGQEGKDLEVKLEKLDVSLDLDAFLDQLGLSESDMKLPTAESQKASPASSASSSKAGSLHSVQSSSEPAAMAPNITVLSLKGLPSRDPASRAKDRSSTLPPRQRGPESGHSLPRSSHSTSLTRFQQMSAHGSLLPLHIPLAPSTSKPLSFSNTPLSPTHVLQSPPANPPTTLPKPLSPSELLMLKEQPGRDARSRTKGRCSTLPARPRGPEAGDSSAKLSQSTSFTKMEDFVPPSPSKLKHDTPV